MTTPPERLLSPREYDVLLLTAEGKRYPEIALELGLAHTTVNTYAEHIRIKLDAHTMAQAVAHAYHRGILWVPRD